MDIIKSFIYDEQAQEIYAVLKELYVRVLDHRCWDEYNTGPALKYALEQAERIIRNLEGEGG